MFEKVFLIPRWWWWWWLGDGGCGGQEEELFCGFTMHEICVFARIQARCTNNIYFGISENEINVCKWTFIHIYKYICLCVQTNNIRDVDIYVLIDLSVHYIFHCITFE